MKEFTLDCKPDLQFRFKNIKPTELLALQMTINFNDFEKTTKLFEFILENTEVLIAQTWLNVKEKGRDVYLPVGIENELNVLMDISTKFLTDVVKPVFQKSRE